MGLFSRKREPKLEMADYEPLDISDRDEATDRLAEAFWNEPLQVRNEFANSLLAWAEREDPDAYEAMKRLVLATEYALCVKEWTRKDPDMDSDLAAAKLEVFVVGMVQDMTDGEADGSNYHVYLNADIPIIVRKLYTRLFEAHQEKS